MSLIQSYGSETNGSEIKGSGINGLEIDGDERYGYFFEDLELGMQASYRKTITATDIELFADLSGDDNPVHLCNDFAAETPFKERIAHGILTASLLSTVLGTKLPGPGCIYVSQSLNFRAPVRIGDQVVATAEISDLEENRRRAIFTCRCDVGETTVLDGEAVLFVPGLQD